MGPATDKSTQMEIQTSLCIFYGSICDGLSFKLLIEISGSIKGNYILFETWYNKVSKMAKIRNPYNQAPHPTQDTTRESDKTR